MTKTAFWFLWSAIFVVSVALNELFYYTVHHNAAVMYLIAAVMGWFIGWYGMKFYNLRVRPLYRTGKW